MADHRFQPETLAIHAGQIPDAATGARALPIYQTTSFVFDSADHAASLFNLQTFGNVYSRLSNPTVAVLEERVAALEGGRAALASASGMAAEAMALLTLLEQGDHVVAAGALYGGSVSMLAVNLAKLGIETTFVDGASIDAFAAAMRPRTRAVFAESLGNPSLQVLDIAAVAEVAHAHGVPLVVDNTVPSPFLCNPIRFGADIVVHSATKYLNGHSDVIGGIAVVGAGDRLAPLRERLGFLQNAVGAIAGPFDSFLVLRGVKTLALRMERHCASALELARWLEQQPLVKRVHYPGLASHPQHQLAVRQMHGFGGMISLELATDLAGTRRFLEAVRIFALAESLGGVESLIEHPAIMTHATIPLPSRQKLGIGDALVRLSVGIEDIDDLTADLSRALAAI